jgi:prolipoprotein diacylglyceryl transferase
MSVAFLPSPARSVWHAGPIAVRAYALCLIAGVLAGLWIAARRYRAAGGRPAVVLDIATVAVPAGLVGARLYSALTDHALYFGHGRDWVDFVRIWDGGLGVPGAVAGGALATWLYCRRTGIALSPLAAAAAPALAFAQAIGCWGGWFSQNLYGRPSTLPWAAEISPVQRLSGFENYATFQPVFLYESLWALGMGILLIYARQRLVLTGDRVFALYAALYAIGRFGAESLRIGYVPRLFGLRVNQVTMMLILAGAGAYLLATRARTGPDLAADPRGAAGRETGGPVTRASDEVGVVGLGLDSLAPKQEPRRGLADPDSGVAVRPRDPLVSGTRAEIPGTR